MRRRRRPDAAVDRNALTDDAAGALWIGAPNQLMRWHDGSFDSYLREQLQGHALSSVSSIRTAPGIGFYGASSMERLPTEVALTEQTRRFKSVQF